MSALLSLDSLSAHTPEGRPLFEGLTLSIGPRDRFGVVGRNGSGKSTLLSIIAGDVAPADGHCLLSGRLGRLDQSWSDSLPVAEVLGVAGVRAAIERVERGVGREADFALADWTLEARLLQALSEVGLGKIALDRPVGSFSGGERTRIALARLLIEAPDLILLDEPTNNLDAEGRSAVAALLTQWRGGVIVASHDRALLEQVDRIIELAPNGIRQVGGGWSTYVAMRDADRARAAAELQAASRETRAVQRAVQDRAEGQARRDRAGRAYAASGSAPRILLGRQAERAENSSGRNGRLAERQVADAQDRLEAARSSVEVATPIAIVLAPTGLPADRELLAVERVSVVRGGRHLGPWTLAIRGPERVALCGPNGSGKSTLLQIARGYLEPGAGTVRRAAGRLALLDQHVGLLDPHRTILECFLAMHSGTALQDAHAALARFAFRNRDAHRIVGTLSGGERLRAGLACVLGGPNPVQLLMLDEPTNHLDVETVELLEAALTDYDGALLIVSHDQMFLDAVGVDRTIAVDAAEPAPA